MTLGMASLTLVFIIELNCLLDAGVLSLLFGLADFPGRRVVVCHGEASLKARVIAPDTYNLLSVVLINPL